MDIGYEAVREIELTGIPPSNKLNIAFIVGQTGAGKTTLIKYLMQNSDYQNHVIIDNDMWRAFAPNYQEVITKFGTDERQEVTSYTKKWRNMLFEECIDRQYNMIYHTSLTNVEEVTAQANRLKREKYSISLVILACNSLESRLSNCVRYINSVLRKRFWKIFNGS